jgi:hypothetical protein
MKQLICIVFLALLIMPGCGRKLDPMPPAKEDPVVIQSITYDDKTFIVKFRVNTDDADVTLLGKAQGICPQCEDDMLRKETMHASKGSMVIKDNTPQAKCMVYRILLEKGNVSWSTPARIFCSE